MRLLELDGTGKLSLVERSGDKIPEYAILSHTWGPAGEEVTFEDLMNNTGRHKPGYDKIKFCAKQSDQDGLKFFWVDTCCINKANFTELSEAINSMFRWYREATRCYVYLSDAPDPKDPTSTIESAFPKSRWFKRGWTLQELIAPSSVQFFSRGGELLGDKKSREQQIHQITRIGIRALQGNDLSQFHIDERFSWQDGRDTTVEEDAAYCLLGIFNIHMPLIYGEGRKEAFDRLRRKIQKSSNPTSVASRAVPWIVPFEKNPHFTGRESQLAQLEESLFAKDHTTKIGIFGLGGVGKTQLALELLYRTKDRHKNCSVIWILVTSMESLHQGYLNVAQQLKIPGWEEEKVDVRELVQDYLSKDDAGQWLLVFDNADDIDMWITKPGPGQEPKRESSHGSRPLIDYLPRSKQGCIIFTTRDMKTAVKLAPKNVVRVPQMNEEVATRLLKTSLVNPDLVENPGDVTALVLELTCLPLAIVQAAAYINENGITFADYLSLLKEKEEEVIDLLSEEFEEDGRYRDVKNAVATTWLVSFERIRRCDPLAAEYLSFMACVDPKDIPQSLLPPGQSRKKETDAIGTLNAYSFASKRPVGAALDLHRLVHLATRNWLRKEGRLAQAAEIAIVRLEEVFPDDDDKNRSVWRSYLPHARYALESDQDNKDGEKRLALMWRYGRCLYSDGRWNEAETIYTRLLEIEKTKLGADHPNTLTSISHLASTYRNQGRWDQAEELQVQVMEILKRKLGEGHLDTLTSISNLALIYWNQGRWDQAKKLQVQVLKSHKRKLGEDHPDTLISISNLASTYWNQGRWDQAKELQVQVMEIRKRKLGEDHPDTLISISHLALTYWKQGRWDQAEELQVQVMEIRKRKLGEDHPDTLISISNLASTYRHQGRWDQAEKLQLQVVKRCKRKLGEDHPDTLISISNLASTYRHQGRWDQAEKLQLQVVKRCKRKLGEDHPDTLISISNLASTYRNQGRWDQAEELEVQVMESRKRKLGENHPSTLISISNLALTYWKQGRWDQAEELQVQVMEIRKRKLGEGHPDTLISINNLAYTWKSRGRDKEALQLMEDCVQRGRHILGDSHPHFLSSCEVLAAWQAEHANVGASA